MPFLPQGRIHRYSTDAYVTSRFLIAMFFCSLGVSSVAGAQSGGNDAEARQLFQEGVRHANAERWSEAVRSFEASYALAPRPATKFNLAGARGHTGQLVQAATAYRELLEGLDPSADVRASVERALAEVVARTPHVQIRVANIDADDEVLLDGERVSRTRLGTALVVNPGSHIVVVQRAGASLEERRFVATEREESSVDITLVAATVPSCENPPCDDTHREDPPAVSGGGGILSEPWFWIVVSVVVVGAGVGIGVAVAGQGPGREYVDPNNFNGGVIRVDLHR